MGPYGSGKTTACLQECTRLAALVPRNRYDGVKYAVGLVVRDTYRNLERNTLPSWSRLVGPVKQHGFKGGSGGEPATHRFRYEVLEQGPDGTRRQLVDLTMLFVAIGEHAVKEFMDGFEPSFVFLNGVDALPRDIIRFAKGRAGRFPDKESFEDAVRNLPADELAAYIRRYKHVLCDMNAPDMDNWAFKDFIENPKKGFGFFRQPGGRDPDAENIQNLDPAYYDDMAEDEEEWWVRRYVDNKPGYSRSGEPVYDFFDDQKHVARHSLPFDPYRTLVVGMDTHRSPAAVCLQKDSHGVIRILGECVPPRKEGARQFGKRLGDYLSERFPDARSIIGVADPSGGNQSEVDDDLCWIETVSNRAKIDIIEATTNAWTPRYEALNKPMRDPIDTKRWGLIISGPDCPKLWRALMSGYQYEKKKANAEDGDTKDNPAKNQHSHVAEAAQYGAMHLADMNDLMGRDRPGRQKTQVDTEHDPLAAF
jgi:hypothetical protein